MGACKLASWLNDSSDTLLIHDAMGGTLNGLNLELAFETGNDDPYPTVTLMVVGRVRKHELHYHYVTSRRGQIATRTVCGAPLQHVRDTINGKAVVTCSACREIVRSGRF